MIHKSLLIFVAPCGLARVAVISDLLCFEYSQASKIACVDIYHLSIFVCIFPGDGNQLTELSICIPDSQVFRCVSALHFVGMCFRHGSIWSADAPSCDEWRSRHRLHHPAVSCSALGLPYLIWYYLVAKAEELAVTAALTWLDCRIRLLQMLNGYNGYVPK